jgi:hypothetical protein
MSVGRCLSSPLVEVEMGAEIVLERSAEQVNNRFRNVSTLIRLQSV